MEVFSLFSLLTLVIATLGQAGLVRGSSDDSNQVSLKQVATGTKFSSSWEPKREPPIQASKCPEDSQIFPCTCSNAVIVCAGPEVNQSSVETTFREIREVNGIPAGRGVRLDRFHVEETELTQLDLAPFYGSQMNKLVIAYNYNLTKLVTSGSESKSGSGSSEDLGSINVTDLYLGNSPLKREGFGDALKYFSNEMIYFYASHLDLNNNNNNNSNNSNETEFLPGLSALTTLKQLNFYSCNISGRLTSDTVIPKQLKNLEVINLSYNKINEVGELVFDFEDGREFFQITLSNNELNERSFHPNSGIAKSGRETSLWLEFNQIQTLPSEIFETFLNVNPYNVLDFYQNGLMCDERVSWIKAGRKEFQGRVLGSDCSNDPGHTLFDSDLIP